MSAGTYFHLGLHIERCFRNVVRFNDINLENYDYCILIITQGKVMKQEDQLRPFLTIQNATIQK